MAVLKASGGLFAAFEENRDNLLRYFRAHGAGDAAEDCLQDLWLRISTVPPGPVSSPIGYLYRAATNLMIDRQRSERAARQRDLDWADLGGGSPYASSEEPGADRWIGARQQLDRVSKELAKLPARALTILRRHRIDGLTQREVARELGLSASTVEHDLRLAYRLLANLREQFDEE